MHTRPAYFYSHGGDYNLSFLQQPSARLSIDPSDYGDNPMDDMNTHFQDSQPKSKKIATTQRLALLDDQDFMSHSSTARVASCGSDTFGDDDLLLGDAMVGLADSQKLQASKDVDHDIMQPLQDALGLRYEVGFHDDEFPMDFDYPGDHGDTQWQGHGNASTMPLATDRPDIAQGSHKTLAHSTNSVQAPVHDLKSVKALRENSGQEEPRELVATQDNDHPKMSGKRAEDNMNVLDLLDMFERESVMEEKPVPQAFKGLEPWLFQEFGDIVELVDD
jgi:ATP-dependent DNA helicase HFM1/MER3